MLWELPVHAFHTLRNVGISPSAAANLGAICFNAEQTMNTAAWAFSDSHIASSCRHLPGLACIHFCMGSRHPDAFHAKHRGDGQHLLLCWFGNPMTAVSFKQPDAYSSHKQTLPERNQIHSPLRACGPIEAPKEGPTTDFPMASTVYWGMMPNHQHRIELKQYSSFLFNYLGVCSQSTKGMKRLQRSYHGLRRRG